MFFSTLLAGSGRVNLVALPSVVTSPRDMALAAVICSALATVLLALLVLCVIYCKRQLLEKKPSGLSQWSEADFLCSLKPLFNKFDGLWLHVSERAASELIISVLPLLSQVQWGGKKTFIFYVVLQVLNFEPRSRCWHFNAQSIEYQNNMWFS